MAKITASAPGRINLIGEHTDYNGGWVLPMAIGYRTRLSGRVSGSTPDAAAGGGQLRDAGSIVLRSAQFPEVVHSHVENIVPTGTWGDYVLGVARQLQVGDHPVGGFAADVDSTVPPAAGLSSSAALEVAAVAFLDAAFDLKLSDEQKIKIARLAENEFVRVPCGIMDQFIAVAARKGHALLIDCRAVTAEAVPINLADASFLICDSGVRRSLAASAYAERLQECREAVKILRAKFHEIIELRDAGWEHLLQARPQMPERIFRRARHVVSENDRTRQAAICLQRGETTLFGRLLQSSHKSLRDDYEVSCQELDFLVDAALAQTGVIGARLTGAGFGGCVLMLVQSERASEIVNSITDAYQRKFGRTAKFLSTEAADGVQVWHGEA